MEPAARFKISRNDGPRWSSPPAQSLALTTLMIAWMNDRALLDGCDGGSIDRDGVVTFDEPLSAAKAFILEHEHGLRLNGSRAAWPERKPDLGTEELTSFIQTTKSAVVDARRRIAILERRFAELALQFQLK